MERNFREKMSSKNPSTTFTSLSQLPDLGIWVSRVGKRANSVKGRANAMAKPSMPMVGATMLPVVDTSTSRKPMMGPVHENDTSVSVKAIKKILSRPLVFSALLSAALPHEDGSVISNHPKNDAANTSSRRKKKMLKSALVDSAFSALAPKMAVMASPKARYMTTMLMP